MSNDVTKSKRRKKAKRKVPMTYEEFTQELQRIGNSTSIFDVSD